MLLGMHLASINIGKPRQVGTKGGTSGIYKEPVGGSVHIGPLGLDSDAVVDTKHHGGVDQAVYIYGTPDYDWWSRELGHPLAPGTFGENLTITDLISAEFNIGDRLQVGSALLEVTSPRIPCSTLAWRMGDQQFIQRFTAAERFGLYCRVLAPAPVQSGDPVHAQRYAGPTISALEMFRLFYSKDFSEEFLRRAIASPAHHRAKEEYAAALADLESARP
jgi:MOSC domain-containing protein YiiM